MAILGPVQRYGRDDAGAISVESVFVVPILLWAIAAMFVYFDAFKSQNVNIKATNTVADLISRQTDAMDARFIQGMNSVYGYLIRSGDDNDLIVSVVAVGLADDGATPELQLRWSYATGDQVAFTDIAQLRAHVPTMAVGDQLIVVHSHMTWSPPLNFGLAEMELTHVAFTRPRFTPHVVWSNSGSGGGTDTGGSIYISADESPAVGGNGSDGTTGSTGGTITVASSAAVATGGGSTSTGSGPTSGGSGARTSTSAADRRQASEEAGRPAEGRRQPRP